MNEKGIVDELCVKVAVVSLSRSYMKDGRTKNQKYLNFPDEIWAMRTAALRTHPDTEFTEEEIK
jgi:hypothetical protein